MMHTLWPKTLAAAEKVEAEPTTEHLEALVKVTTEAIDVLGDDDDGAGTILDICAHLDGAEAHLTAALDLLMDVTSVAFCELRGIVQALRDYRNGFDSDEAKETLAVSEVLYKGRDDARLALLTSSGEQRAGFAQQAADRILRRRWLTTR